MSTHGYLVLVRHREFRALWTGSAWAFAAGTVAGLSLGTLVYAQTGSPLLATATMFGPSLVQLAGAFVMSIGIGVWWGLLAEVLPRGKNALARSAMNVSLT